VEGKQTVGAGFQVLARPTYKDIIKQGFDYFVTEVDELKADFDYYLTKNNDTVFYKEQKIELLLNNLKFSYLKFDCLPIVSCIRCPEVSSSQLI
jgi:hypothetical protein